MLIVKQTAENQSKHSFICSNNIRSHGIGDYWKFLENFVCLDSLGLLVRFKQNKNIGKTVF